MLTLAVKGRELYDDVTNEFHVVPDMELEMEHSLETVAKWESKWKKPFLSNTEKTTEQAIDYIRMMCSKDPGEYIGFCLTQQLVDKIDAYISDSMTAAWFSDNKKGRSSSDVITAEIIYYWMISLNIPMECAKWHLNRLLTLIRVTSLKNQPPKKMSQKELYSRQRSLNAARRKASGSKG